jgi:tRNA-uridine 2-sulfurtransferase
MSGGVDSSVAAALLARQGHEVIGLSMQLYDQSSRDGQSFGSCCTLDDLHDARRVAAQVGFPHYIVNFEEKFAETVVADFVREYAAGRTPIPCVHCNGDLKFATLVDRAAGFDAAFVATGHYARVELDAATSRYKLRRGLDATKDQSYFLFTLTQAQLAHAMFPIGALDKTAVREQARELGLVVADKPDSHEICFVPDGDHAAFLGRQGVAPGTGEFRDATGQVIGHHAGVQRFTVGQRKGLGLSSRIPLYVVGIDAAENSVTVGPREALDRHALTASAVNWIAGTPPRAGSRVTAQIRHRHKEAAATIAPHGDNRVSVVFDQPQAAIAPGQALVMYSGDEVVGGGWID